MKSTQVKYTGVGYAIGRTERQKQDLWADQSAEREADFSSAEFLADEDAD